MDDSITFLNENSVAGSSRDPAANGAWKSVSDDEDDDEFIVPLPQLDEPDDEDYTEALFTQVRINPGKAKSRKDNSKEIEKAAAAEARAKAKELKLAEKRERKELAEKKKAERLEQRLAKEAEKLLKKHHREATQARQPKSLIKNVMILVDKRIQKLVNSIAFERIAQENLIEPTEPVALEFVDAEIPNSITWKLRDPEDGTDRIITSCEVVVVLPIVDFANLVHGSSIKNPRENLESYFRDLKSKTQEKIILILLGLDGYLLNHKTLKNREHRQQVGDSDDNAAFTKGLKSFNGLKSIVSPDKIDRALVQLQMAFNIPHMNAADVTELGTLIQHFTKALVEKPEKKRKRAAEAAINWQELAPSKAVKLGDDGSGYRELWKRIVQQTFSRQSPTFADAVVQKYGNPRILLDAYRSCTSVDLARNLLSAVDEGGRRQFEASRRVHMAFTSREANAVIDRDK